MPLSVRGLRPRFSCLPPSQRPCGARPSSVLTSPPLSPGPPPYPQVDEDPRPPLAAALSATRCLSLLIRPCGSVSLLRRAAPSLSTASLARSRLGSREAGRWRCLVACTSVGLASVWLALATAAAELVAAGGRRGSSSSSIAPPCPKTSGSDMSASSATDGGPIASPSSTWSIRSPSPWPGRTSPRCTPPLEPVPARSDRGGGASGAAASMGLHMRAIAS